MAEIKRFPAPPQRPAAPAEISNAELAAWFASWRRALLPHAQRFAKRHLPKLLRKQIALELGRGTFSERDTPEFIAFAVDAHCRDLFHAHLVELFLRTTTPSRADMAKIVIAHRNAPPARRAARTARRPVRRA